MNQKPKPLPAGGRYDFEFRKHERVDQDDTVFEASVRDRVDPSKDYMIRQVMSRTMLDIQHLEAKIVVRELTNYIVKHLVRSAIEKVLPTMCQDSTVKSTEPPPVATCNKTFADCAKHGNTLQYCGYVNVNTGRHVPCPHTFGDSHCTGSKFLYTATVPGDFAVGGPVVGVDPQGRPLVINDGGLIDYAMGDIDLAHNLASAKEALEECKKRLKDCDVCYGTGRFKGFGGPCSEGCPAKESK